eukprot:TRINITY_DN6040_c0_g1_i1.p1 TRINITY_DN6040_c0_g1~~TRINITY_DN6040_c0_g1_i1.p1  ORF type:complete len:261 (+),score=81.60 TRINITY_DN6040_c0_g1_i1:40-783(+)
MALPVPVKCVYTPAMYQLPAPPALPPSEDPLPAERQRQKEMERKRKEADKQQSYNNKIRESKEKGGLFSSISSGLFQAAAAAEGFVDRTYDSVNNEVNTKTDEQSLVRFRKLGYPVSEALILDFHCFCISGQFAAEGFMFVSTHYLTFDGTVKALYSASKQDESLAFAVPLTSIVSLHHGVSLRALEKGRPPQLQLTPDRTIADAILVYTKEGHVHQFWDFRNFMVNWYGEAWTVLDHAWRAQMLVM